MSKVSSAKYCQEILLNKFRERYQSLSKEEKEKKRQHGREQYKSLLLSKKAYVILVYIHIYIIYIIYKSILDQSKSKDCVVLLVATYSLHLPTLNKHLYILNQDDVVKKFFYLSIVYII